MKNLNLLVVCFIMGDALASRMASASKGETMSSLIPPKKLSNFVKGNAPMAQDNEGYILYPASYPEHTIRRIHAKKSHSVSHHAFMYKNEASSSRHSTHVKMSKKKDRKSVV